MSDLQSETNFDVRVERPASGGGVGRAPDGRVTFVRYSLPGELVLVEVNETTSSFYRADAIEVLEASLERVTPPCPYFHVDGCGGCDLQHASPLAQADWKAALVKEHLRRIAGLEWDVTVDATPDSGQGSRTRLRCGVDEDGVLGLRQARSHQLVAIDDCWIADPVFASAFAHAWPGVEELELRAIGEGVAFAVARRKAERGVHYDLRSLEGAPLDPSTHSRVAVRDHVYRVGPQSFWQSHRDAPEMLVNSVLEFANAVAGDDVVDLFSGVGLFSVPLAKLVGPGGRVSAVESSPHAVRDARENAEGLRHLKVREWSVSPRSVNDTVREGSIVVLDPPRHGLAKGVAEAIVRRAPRRVVYVSCDAATFSRDLKDFLRRGFALSDLRVFDLFPMTEHVELVALLDSPA
ncbi:MAG TPA: TRAM domain-containing protein [Acidimicrobiales bacterium]|jgi:tRNA/tmRNA/rRNA uracil-C5-methylase (TrmA/RlmC/RlmD family)